MEREDTGKLMLQTQEMIQKCLGDMKDSRRFMEFDRFLIEHFLSEETRKALQDDASTTEDALKALRECAYLCCYHQLKDNCPVARMTLRSWFHLGTKGRPSRDQMIAFAFALSLSREELEEYLICGLQEPAIQINDYQEMIYCYGLEQGISYEECQDMIEVFEQEISEDISFAQNTHTDELWALYEEKKYLKKEDFLIWMCGHGFYFKGYSKVALNCFIELKHEILEYIRAEAKRQLYDLLQAAGFFKWAAEQQIPETAYGKEIPRFLHNVLRRKNQYLLDQHTKEEITRLSWIVYSSKDKNSDLLAELYASAISYDKKGRWSGKKKISSRRNFDLPKSVYFMTDKYVSQLLGVAQQKEKEIRLSMAKRALSAAGGVCPVWVRECMETYGLWKDTDNVEKMLKKLEHVLRQQKQRCQLVKRSDLLPLIHYVAQKRYEQQRWEDAEYVRQDALEIFTVLANQVFSKCQMAELDDRYQLDYLFCATYGEREMYSLSDVIEVSMR